MLARHCLLFVVLVVCVYTDLSHRKIYNWSTLPAIFVGLLFNFVLGGLWEEGWSGANLGGSLIAVGVVLLIFGWPYLKGGIAAGDVKFMLAVAAIGGLRNFYIINALFYTALIGFLMAILALIWRGRLWAGLKGAFRFTFSIEAATSQAEGQKAPESKVTIPYGVAIAIGSLIAWYLVELPSQVL